MRKPQTWITAIALALYVAACNSEPNSSVRANSPTGGTTTSGTGTATTAQGGAPGSTSRSSTSSNAAGGSTARDVGGGSGQSTNDSAGGDRSSAVTTNSSNSVGGASSSRSGDQSTGVAGGARSDSQGGVGGRSSGAANSSSSKAAGGQTTTSAGPAGGVTAAGGAATAGQATGSGGATSSGSATEPTPEPELITSGPNAFWKTEGQVKRLTSGSAEVTVDETTKFQIFDGFGGTFNEMGWDALSVVSSEIPNALKLLFDPIEGANFIYGRVPLGASDYAMSWYTLDETQGDYAMDKFSIARDREKLIPFIKAALQARADIHLWASPWVVPGWMMDGSKNMKTDAQTLGAHALYMARFVEDYAKEGLEIEAIHPQNEPGYARVHWTQSQFIGFIKTYLGPTFAQRGLKTEIWCGTMSKDPEDTDIAKALAKDADAMKYVTGFGVQWNLEEAVSTLAKAGKVMQTEHRCGNYNFGAPYWDQSRYSSTKAQNDHLYGEESWQLIRDWIVAGVNSYSAWNMVLDTTGKSLDGWPQNALLVVDRATKKLIVTPAYYAFRHYSRYIAPGATRIGTAGSNDAVAFKNPDGRIVAQVYNKGDASKTMTIKVGTGLYQFDIPGHGWATLVVAG